MVANYTTGNGFKGALSYSIQERKEIEQGNKCELISQYNCRGNSSQVAQQMRVQSNERGRVQKPCLHLTVSFPTQDSHRPKADEIKAVDKALKEVGITPESHQYQVVRHNDTKQNHYHIVVNRVDNFGQLHNDHRLKDRLQVACSKVEREMQLHSHDSKRTCIYADNAKGYEYQNKNKRDSELQKNDYTNARDKRVGVQEEKEKIRNAVIVAHHSASLDDFKEKLKEKGIEVRATEKDGKLTGISFKTEKLSVKGSQIGFKAKELQKTFDIVKVWKAEYQAEKQAKAQERAKAEAQAKAEQEKAKAEAQAKAEQEKAKAEAQAKAEQEKAKAEAQAKAEQEKAKAEAQARAEQEKAKAEAQAKAEQEQPTPTPEAQEQEKAEQRKEEQQQREQQTIKEYERAVNSFDRNFATEYSKKGYADLNAIAEKNGFKLSTDGYTKTFRASTGLHITTSNRKYFEANREGKEQRDKHKEAKAEYERVSKFEPKKEKDFFITIKKNVEYNKQLSEAKEKARQEVARSVPDYKLNHNFDHQEKIEKTDERKRLDSKEQKDRIEAHIKAYNPTKESRIEMLERQKNERRNTPKGEYEEMRIKHTEEEKKHRTHSRENNRGISR